MDLVQVVGGDAAILVFSAAGLVATTVAILLDTRTQVSDLAKAPIRTDY